MSQTPRILVSNDDGHFSEGVRCLVEAVAPLGEVWVVAPEVEQSASSHAISLHRPLRIREIRPRWFSVDGTPSDCSYLAIHHILKDRRPTLMVSGINHGANLADDVTYSGTVAAAMESAILGVPAIAFSLVSRHHFDFTVAQAFARSFVAEALSRPLPERMLLSVNIPGDAAPDAPWAVTRLGRHSYGVEVVENTDPRGRKYYWIGGNAYEHEDIPGSDCNAIFKEKIISVTPLHLDLTDDSRMAEVAGWTPGGFEQVQVPGKPA
ncbi:MAG TPA: 5'/3'-nucleotidase SurE [Myxococcaceae bacterium]|nr:5'/3'-nucleotidase SurE [Myxococcaceae bacterium]